MNQELLLTGTGNDYDSKTIVGNDSCLKLVRSSGQHVRVEQDGNGNKLKFTSDFSVSFFIKIDSFSANHAIISKSNFNGATNQTRSYYIYVLTDGRLGFLLYAPLGRTADPNSTAITTTGAIVLDRWCHVTCTYSASTFQKVYLNGVKVAENLSPVASIHDTTEDIFFGLGQDATSLLTDSTLNNLLFFDKALTDFEVFHQLYSYGGIPREPLHANVVAHYPLAQRESYSVLSGDTATTRGLSIGDYAAFDVVGQYNNGFTPQHGKLVNYPATVLATATNVSFKEFYDTSQNYRPISGGVEVKTNLPPLVECIEIATGKTISIPNSTLQSIVMVFQVSSVSKTLISYTGGSITTDINNDFQQTGLTNAEFYQDSCSNDNICLLAVNFDSKAFTSLTIEEDLNYAFTFFAFNRKLEGWEFKELFNNQLIYSGNPFAWNNSQNDGFQDAFVHGFQFQTGSYSGVSLTNYGSAANGTLTGFTLPTDIKTINSIR